MNTTTYTDLTGKPYKNYKQHYHDTINFIDDSTNIITLKNSNEIKEYLDNYYLHLHCFYQTNKLFLNSNKTEFIVKETKNITIHIIVKTK